MANNENERKWYDGFFQLGDAITEVSQNKHATANDYVSAVAKTILGTNTDILTNSISGVVGWGEDAIDAGASLVGMLTESLGWENATSNIRNFVERDLYDEQEVARQLLKNGAPLAAFDPTMMGLSQAISTMYTAEEWLNPQKKGNSLLGDTSTGLIQSAGETLAKQGIQIAAGGVPVGDIITGVTVFGAQSEQALREDATFMQAGGSGLISAAAEIMFEKLSSGIKISGRTWDEGLTKLMSRSISNVALRNFFSFVKDIGGEAIEEAATEFVGKLGTLLYKDRDEWDEILFSKDSLVDYIQAAIGGGLMGGAFNAADAVNSSKKGVDYKSGLTNDEQKVVDKVTEKLVKEKESNSEKLSAKEKNLLYESVLNQLEEGDIDISDIEDALGEEVFKDYADTIKYEEDVLSRYDELGKKKNYTLAEASEFDELGRQKTEIENNSPREELKKQMSEKVFERVKGTKLMNSYIDEARRGETFQADINEYEEAERATIQSAIDAGFLNNTNKTRRFVNWVAKIAAKMNIKVDFTNIEKLKESGFAVNGKFVNGYKTKDGIGLNMQSKKLMETVVGHEITHVLEGTKELYKEMQKILYDYADSKGELSTRRKAIEDLYKGMKADIDSELTAELVGDYLFTDQEFINRLANDNRNLFQKIWDEVKYMWKQAHPSSPEAQKLEKLKRAFEEAYKHSSGVKSNDTKLSISNAEGIDNYSKKQYNDFGWARYANALTKNELDDMHSKLHDKGSLQKFPQTRSGEAVVEVNNDPNATLATNNVLVFVTGTIKNPQITRVARFDIDTETEMEIIKEDLYEGRTLSDTYYSFLKEEGIAREYSKKSALDYNGYSQEVRGGSRRGDGNQTDENSGFQRNRSWSFEDNQGDGIEYSISESPDQDAERGYARTDDFRRIQAESQAMSYESWNFYLRGGKNESVQRRVADVLRGEMDTWRSSGGSYNGLLTLQGKDSQFNMYEGVEPELFHDVFEVARKYLENGELVDLHGVETTEDHGIGYKYCYNYLSDDGLSGFSITPDGDLISVFNASDKKGFLRAISDIVNKNAKTLDCYASPNQNLKRIYERVFGFKTASIMDYNMEFDHDNIAENHDHPPVAFMVNTNSDVKTEHFTETQYDEAVAYRDSFVNQDTQFSLSEEATPRDVYFSRIDEVYDKLKGKSAGKSYMVDGYNFFLQRNDFDESAYISITTPEGKKLRQIVDGGNLWKNARLWREAAKMVANNDYPNVATATTQEEAGEYSEIEGKREETKKTFKEKVSDAKTLGRKAVGYLVDKYQPFEELALKTGNRELEAKANSLRTSGRAAQHYIGRGADGVRAINDLRQEVEASGLEKQFEEYMYDLLTTDRMSLEDRAKPVIKKLGDKFKNLRVDQIKAIAKKPITDNTTDATAQTIRDAKEYLRAISTRNKPVRGDFYTADIARAHATELEQKYPQFKQWAEDVYANTNFMLDKLVADGELSQEAADRFRELYPHYVPIRRVNREGKAIDVPLYSNRTGIDAPIKGATGGDGTIGYLFETLAMRAEQTFLAGAKNRLGIELKNTLKAKTTDAEVDVEDIFDEVDTHEDRLKAGEDGQAPTFTVFENGKRVTFEIPEDIYEALKPTPEALKGTVPVLSAISKWQRNVLTEYNPGFMLRNFAKDTQDAFINSQHAKETFQNYPEAFRQLYAYAKGEGDMHWAQEYLANGGESLTYFDGREKLFDSKNTKNPWAKVDTATWKKVIGFVPAKISEASNFVERVPRLAEYIASRKAGASIDVAMLDAARVTTNFAAGGDVTNWANRNGATFLNASVQGAAQAVRNVREAKAQGMQGMLKLGAKVAIAGIPYLILNALLWGDDDEYEELSDYIKENYYIVAKYGDGQFVRIPKGRMAAVIQSAFQQMSNLVTGDDEVDFKRFGELMWENIAPNNPLENNVFAPIKNALENKTWYGDDLVPQRLQDLPAGEQSDETTDAISKWLGETFNVSPYKLNYLLDQYSGVFGDVLLPYATPQAEGGNSSILGGAIAPLADQFTTDSVMKNQNVSDFYDTLEDLTASAKSKYATDEDVLRYRYMNTINSELSNLYKAKREAQNSDLPNNKKYETVREIQRQIDLLAEQALNSYDSVKIYGNTAVVGGVTYKKNNKGEWQKASQSTSSSSKIWSDSTIDKFIQDFKPPKVNWD